MHWHYRNDAGLAAAELALAVEKATMATGAIDAVGTTGFFQIGPNTVNSIPREAKLEIDIRDIDAARRDATVKRVLAVSPAAQQVSLLWRCQEGLEYHACTYCRVRTKPQKIQGPLQPGCIVRFHPSLSNAELLARVFHGGGSCWFIFGGVWCAEH